MSPRFMIAAVAGGIVTLGLFFLMHTLIARGGAGKQEQVAGKLIDFIQVKQDSALQTKDRKLPDKVQKQKPPPPPEIDLANMPKPRMGLGANIVAVPEFGLAGGPDIGSAPSDGDIMPLVRIEPRYPPRAQSRGIEGWVLLEFDISTAGTVVNPKVVDSEPSSIFNSSAIRAVKRWKYKPKIEDGVAVVRTGVQVVLRFGLADD